MIYKEDYKIKINFKKRLWLIIFSSFLMLIIILSIIYWGATSKNQKILNYLISSKKFTSINLQNNPKLIDGFIRARSLSVIVSSAVFLGFFGWLVLRGKKIKYSNTFSFFWLFLFFGNGIGVFWYSFQKIDVFIVLQSSLNFMISILLVFFSYEVFKHKQIMRRKNLNKKRKNYGF